MKIFKHGMALMLALAMTVSLAACGGEDAPETDDTEEGELKEITFVLDWTPNTNHTGLYVAQEKGYFEEAGLNVTVVQPPEDGAEMLVASGRAQFGVSFQDFMANALTMEEPLGVTAVAAVLQHNTSGIVSRKGEGMDHPAGLEGKKYATWEMPVEQATLRHVVEADNGDFSKVEMIPSTVTDEVSALQSKSVDAIWIYYGWAGVACEQAGLDIDYFDFCDIDPVFDFYTPIVIANNDLLENDPETAKAFLAALARGYEDAAEDPAGAAEILMKAVPELADRADFIHASQEYLSKVYVAEASGWGQMEESRWSGYYEWINENHLLEREIPDTTAGFTNDFLPVQ